jgi:hypothetical protein
MVGGRSRITQNHMHLFSPRWLRVACICYYSQVYRDCWITLYIQYIYIKVKQSRYTPWRCLRERRYSSYSFSTSALDGGEWSASRPWGRTPGTHWTGGWVGPRAGLDTEAAGKILCPRRESNPDRPVVQPVVRNCTAWANPAPYIYIYI